MTDPDSVIIPVVNDTPVAVDDINNFRHQFVKIEYGDKGTATPVSATNPLPVTLETSVLPTGAATETTLAAFEAANHTDLGTLHTDLGTLVTTTDFDTKVGSLTETAPATDTASSGLNGRLQRLAQRITSLIALLPSALGAGGGLKVDGSGTALPVSGTVTANAGTNLNTSALALETGGNLATLAGAVSSSKMATKAASGDFADGAITTLGTKADAKSTATDTTAITAMQVLKQISASVQAPPSQAVTNAGTFAVQAAQSGTWTVQPGNTANTTAWKVDGSAVTQPVSGTVTANMGTVTADPFGANADAASASGSISAKLRAMATALGTTALDLGSGTGGTRTLRSFRDTAQFVGGNGTTTSATQRVTLSSDGTGVIAATQSGTWNVGTVTTVTAVTAISNALPAGTNTIGKTYAAPQTTKALTQASVSFSSSGENTLVAGTASQTIRVFRLVLVAAAAVSVTIKNAASGTALTGAIPLAANGSLTVDTIGSGEPAFVTATAGAFIVSLSGAVTVTGWIDYIKS